VDLTQEVGVHYTLLACTCEYIRTVLYMVGCVSCGACTVKKVFILNYSESHTDGCCMDVVCGKWGKV
jgi:hypothetical protein